MIAEAITGEHTVFVTSSKLYKINENQRLAPSKKNDQTKRDSNVCQSGAGLSECKA